MADKQATIYIVDLGASMSACHSGRTESDLDWSMKYVWDKICTTVAACRKTWTVGVVGLRTNWTENKMQHEEDYQNIAVLQELGPMGMSSVQSLLKLIKPGSSMVGDAVSAICIAVDMMLVAAPKRLKYRRKIILVTDGMGPISSDDLDQVSKEINDLGVELVVLYVQVLAFDGPVASANVTQWRGL